MNKREKAAVAVCICAAMLSVLIMINQIRLTERTEAVLQAQTAESQTETEIWFGSPSAIDTQAPETTAAATVRGNAYVINGSSKKIHSPNCRYVQNINSENSIELVTDTLDELLMGGYSRCSACGGA